MAYPTSADFSTDKEDRLLAQEVTGSKVSAKQFGQDVVSHAHVYLVGSDAVESGSTDIQVNATSHLALAGDVLQFTSGALNNLTFSVAAVSTNAITLGQKASTAPSAADTFDILRYIKPRASSSGASTVDTELPAAVLVTDDMSNPTAPQVISHLMGMDAGGADNWDRAKLAKAHDLDSGAGTEYGTGVSIRVAASGGSIAQTYGAGAVDAGVQRATLASDDPAVTALQVIDDWDESDRAKANIIVGQAGVEAGAGASTVKTQRVAIATDANAVTIASSLVPVAYDYISLSYTGDNLTTVVYKTGGSGGTTVATLTLAYTGSRLDSVTKT